MPDLKLIAFDAEDLSVLSAHLQDAVLKVGDMTFRPGEKRFAAILRRFDWATALAAADDEVSFAGSCAGHPEQTLVVIHRWIDEAGDIREQFRTVKPGLPFDKDRHSRVFTFHEVEGEEEPEERVDLLGLAKGP